MNSDTTKARNSESGTIKTPEVSQGVNTETGINIECKICGWVWLYKGKHTVFVSCPNCFRKNRLPDAGQLDVEVKANEGVEP
ncbi:MAG: hypothetical protein ACM3UY_03175 [Methanocella sp.]